MLAEFCKVTLKRQPFLRRGTTVKIARLLYGLVVFTLQDTQGRTATVVIRNYL